MYMKGLVFSLANFEVWHKFKKVDCNQLTQKFLPENRDIL